MDIVQTWSSPWLEKEMQAAIIFLSSRDVTLMLLLYTFFDH